MHNSEQCQCDGNDWLGGPVCLYDECGRSICTGDGLGFQIDHCRGHFIGRLDEAKADDSSKSKGRRITKAAIEALFDHFTKMKWPRNKIPDNPSNECNSLLVDFCNYLTKLAGEIFPKRASELTSSELTFLTRVGALKKPLVERWKKLHSSILLHPDEVLTDH